MGFGAMAWRWADNDAMATPRDLYDAVDKASADGRLYRVPAIDQVFEWFESLATQGEILGVLLGDGLPHPAMATFSIPEAITSIREFMPEILLEDGPFAVDFVQDEEDHGLLVDITGSYADHDKLEALAQRWKKIGLVVFDLDRDEILGGGHPKTFSLTTKTGTFFEPEEQTLETQLAACCHAEAYAILEYKTGSYAQMAGGPERYAVEIRFYDPDGFRHLVAGTSPRSVEETMIEGPGGEIRVLQSEALNLKDATLILLEFYRSQLAHDDYVYRDITREFH